MIAGFKQGDSVITPSGREATVLSTRFAKGRELVKVQLHGSMGVSARGQLPRSDRREFYASALRMAGRGASSTAEPRPSAS